MNKKKLLIFDGNSIFNRAFYGIRLLSNSDGLYTNAIYGFLNIYFKYIEEEKPDYISVAFDMRAKTFRHKMYDGYKAQRKGMPEELAMQMPYLKEVLTYLNVNILGLEGFEADDIIGTVSRICDEENILCRIVTGDKDDLQLASDNTVIKLVVTKMGNTVTTDYDKNGVYEKMGVTPTQFIDVKALMGDTSDNIPGVKGIGEKTAFSLIKEYGSVDGVYENTDKLKGAQKEKIINGKEMAYLSYKLALIDRFAPINFSFDDALIKNPDEEKLVSLLTKLELKTIITKLNLKEPEIKTRSYPIIKLDSAKEIPVSDVLYYILNTDGDELKSLSVFANGTIYEINYETAFDVLHDIENIRKLFESNSEKVSHGVKKDIVFLYNNFEISFSGEVFDTEIAAYILEPSKNNYVLSELQNEYLGVKTTEGSEVALIPELMANFSQKIQNNNQEELIYKIEMPLIKVLASMEIEGFKVDKESLNELSESLGKRISELESGIYEYAGENFNINSPKQLGEVLFVKLGLPPVKKTKSGYSTNAEVLEKLENTHPIIKLISDYRTLTKLKSTYADGLYNVINPKTGKINSSFNQTVTATGRISSTEPNLQNIPVRTEEGRQIRKMFIASSDDRILIDADYSQIELRVLAHLSGDCNMIAAFTEGKDIHKITASKAFNVPFDEVTDKMRSSAKAVNFGIVYGISEFSLAKDIGTTRKLAAKYIDDYFKTYPEIKIYLDKEIEFAKENGYVTTELNRRRYIPEIKSSNFNLRSFGERVAMNAPVQGFAADIIKIAMVRVYERLKKENLKSKLILQVHDELIIDAFKDEEKQVRKLLTEEMENAVKLKVPLTVETKSGFSWYETK